MDSTKNISKLNSGLNPPAQDMEMLCNNIPGGIFKCLFDEPLTLIEVSDGFLTLVGYTRAELEHKLGSSLRRLIHPSDLRPALEMAQEQLKEGSTKEIRYRLVHKNGHYITVIDKGTLFTDKEGRPAFYCIVIDITREKEIEEELRLSLERYHIIFNQTNDVIFEWDMLNNSFLVTNTWERKFGERCFDLSNSPSDILDSLKTHMVNPNDFDTLENCIRDIRTGIPYIEKNMRLLDKTNRYVWCKLRITQQLTPGGRPFKIIGVITDIDREIQKSQNLKRKAEQDAMTGMYNKVITHSLIKNYLQEKPDEVSALMIIDIDNFKTINDTMGHLYGDAVLVQLSRVMRRSFRDTDILGRIGGDEFLIFLKAISSPDNAELNAEKTLHLFTELKKKEKIDAPVSCSIGIALYPHDGKDFATLYHNADHALYQAKHDGKNRYALYSQSSIPHSVFSDSQVPCRTAASEGIDFTESTGILQYIFHILYNTKNLTPAISAMLEVVGKHFQVSRVYIFENSEDCQYCSNTFEWCDEGVFPQKSCLQHLSYEQDLGGSYQENFNEENIFYCPDVKKLSNPLGTFASSHGIKSLLQCSITDNGEFRGFVGFDECRKNRYWSKDQIDVLAFIAEILSTFLLKYRAVERYQQENEVLLSVLDNQDAWIYVIDPDTRKVLFLNRKSRAFCADSPAGNTCYEIFKHSFFACDNCPADHLSDDCPNFSTEFYNPSLNLWVSSDASLISWHGKKAVLVTCRDISKYKK